MSTSELDRQVSNGSVGAGVRPPAPRPSPAPRPTPRGRETHPDPAPPAPAPLGPGTDTASSRRPVLRLVLVAVLIIVLGAGSGFVGAGLVTPQYAAHSDVLYMLTREQPTGFLREDRNLSTQLVVLTSRRVLDPVAVAHGIGVEELAARITPTVVQESEVINIELRDPDPAEAQSLLDDVLSSYIDTSNNGTRSEVQDYLNGQLTEITKRLAAVTSDPVGRAAERAPLVDREQQLRSQLDELQLADLAGPAAQVLVPPYTDPLPVYPQQGFAAVAGALTGLVLALIAVAVLARRRLVAR